MGHNIRMKDEEMNELFKLFDTNGEGTIDYEEFLIQVRPPMNAYRLDLVKRAFVKMDRTGDEKVSYNSNQFISRYFR